MRAAYTSGHVFGGQLDVPAIDHRQYMERELNMHNSHQSFARGPDRRSSGLAKDASGSDACRED